MTEEEKKAIAEADAAARAEAAEKKKDEEKPNEGIAFQVFFSKTDDRAIKAFSHGKKSLKAEKDKGGRWIFKGTRSDAAAIREGHHVVIVSDK
jgi:hypothetical protein